MIQLRENLEMTVGEFMKALEDTYHDYFPKSYVDIQIDEYFKIIGEADRIGVSMYLKSDKNRSDPLRGMYFVIRPEQKMALDEDTVLPSKLFLRWDSNTFGCVDEIVDNHICWEVVPADISAEVPYEPEEILEWFHDYSKRLCKTFRKMLRQGRLNKEWEEYL